MFFEESSVGKKLLILAKKRIFGKKQPIFADNHQIIAKKTPKPNSWQKTIYRQKYTIHGKNAHFFLKIPNSLIEISNSWRTKYTILDNKSQFLKKIPNSCQKIPNSC